MLDSMDDDRPAAFSDRNNARDAQEIGTAELEAAADKFERVLRHLNGITR